jgi:hypothetical protein
MLVSIVFFNIAMENVESVTEEQIKVTIEKGVEWLASRQNADGSWGISTYKVALTAFVLTKLQEYAYEIDTTPFKSSFPYRSHVEDGWKFLFNNSQNASNIHKQPIFDQKHGNRWDDPDSRPNNYGLHFTYTNYMVYSTSICLIALEASGKPNRPNDGGIDFDGDSVPDTYFEVAQDIVDWLAFAQNDMNKSQGGWGYSYYNNSYGGADNSNTGYVVLGLAAAEEFGCTIPGWVRRELNIWIDNTQNPLDGGALYSPGSSSGNLLRTGNLIFEMTFYGDPPSTARFKAAVDYIEATWRSTTTNPGWGYSQQVAEYQAMFCLMKGFEYSGIDYIDLDNNNEPEHNWFDEFATVLIEQQNKNGSWPVCAHSDKYMILSTTWALLTIEKIIPPDKPPQPEDRPLQINAGGPYIGFEGGTIYFDASLGKYPESNIVYRWDFNNDGIWDTDWLEDPEITYTFGDDWIGTAILEAMDLTSHDNISSTKTAKDTAQVIIKNVAPILSTISEITIKENETLTLEAAITDPGSDDLVVEWLWGHVNTGNKYTAYLNNPSYPDPYPSTEINQRNINDQATNEFNNSGVYQAMVLVTDDDGGVGISNITISVIENISGDDTYTEPPTIDPPVIPENEPPIVSLNANKTSGTAPLIVAFEGLGYDTDGNLISYSLNFDDGMLFDLVFPTPTNNLSTYPIHIFKKPGIYHILLEFTDDDNATSSDDLTIVVFDRTKNIFTVSGHVYKYGTSSKIAHVNVAMNYEQQLTNYSGFYSFSVQKGICYINVSKDGYEPAAAIVTVTNSDITLDFYLAPIITTQKEKEPASSFEPSWNWIWIFIFILVIILSITSLLATTRRKSRIQRPPAGQTNRFRPKYSARPRPPMPRSLPRMAAVKPKISPEKVSTLLAGSEVSKPIDDSKVKPTSDSNIEPQKSIESQKPTTPEKKEPAAPQEEIQPSSEAGSSNIEQLENISAPSSTYTS